MSKNWPHAEACVKAGELYGNLLARDSDPSGFRYAMEMLTTGQASVREIVRQICRSDEFREKHMMNQTPNELARRILTRLGSQRPAPEQIKQLALDILERDWREAISDYIDSRSYIDAFGDDRVPLWS
jgi:hypothetical protein